MSCGWFPRSIPARWRRIARRRTMRRPGSAFRRCCMVPTICCRAYPQPELLAVRKAFAEAKAAYLDRLAADRPAKFAAAMERFAASLRALAEKIEPLRERLPLRHRDQELIDATAYPPPGSTDAEVFYNRLDPFFWSWVVSLAATLCLLLAVGRWRKPLFWLGAAVLVAGQGSQAPAGVAGLHHRPGAADGHVRDRRIRGPICRAARSVVRTVAAVAAGVSCKMTTVGAAMRCGHGLPAGPPLPTP